MARLVRSQVEMEGRYEERWTLVEDDSTPEYADGEPLAVVGHPHPRVSAAARLSGSARFISDISLQGMAHAAVLRSPHANARVSSLDLAAAAALPGVRCVIGPGDLPDRDGRPVLTDTPEYAGAAVAAVAADTPEAAERALAALAPAWEPLAFVVDLDEGLARQSFTEDPSETSRGDVDAALAGAAAIVDAEYRTPAQVQNPLETHCAVAVWEAGALTVWSSTQGIFAARDELARAYDLEPDDVRVVCEFMGGGFGGKQGAGPEGFVAAELARRSGRPVRLVYSRAEETIASGHRAPTVQTYRIGADADGKLLGIEGSAVIGVGLHGWVFPVLNPAETLYACENVRSMVLPVKLNLGFSNAFRAPGVMEGAFGFEQAIDELADLARDRPARDPAAKRRRPRAVERQPLHVQAPRDLPAPRDRARRLGAAQRPALAGPHPPRSGHGEPDLVGRRRPPGARHRAHGPQRPADACLRLPGHRHRHDDRLGGDRRRVARRARRLGARAGGRHRPVGLRPDVGRIDDARVGRPGGALGRARCAHPAARARLRPVRDRRVRPRHRRRRRQLARRHAPARDHRDHVQARQLFARRARLARAEPRRDAHPHVRLPGGPDRGRHPHRSGDRRAGVGRARRRPHHQSDGGDQPGHRAACCRRSASR